MRQKKKWVTVAQIVAEFANQDHLVIQHAEAQALQGGMLHATVIMEEDWVIHFRQN